MYVYINYICYFSLSPAWCFSTRMLVVIEKLGHSESSKKTFRKSTGFHILEIFQKRILNIFRIRELQKH